MTKNKNKEFISGIEYCVKCKEVLKSMSVINNFTVYPFLFAPDKKTRELFYCINKKCSRFGLLSLYFWHV